MRKLSHSKWLAVTGRSLLVGLIACNAMQVIADVPPAPPPTQPVAKVTDLQPAVVDVRKTVEYLASPELEGRGAGTEGNNKAGDHIAGVFKQLGLQPPAGWNGYFQPFKMTTATSIDPKTILSAGDGKNWLEALGGKLELGKHYQPLSFSTEGKIEGELVFVGYGVADAKKGYDDYAGIDVKGKVVVAMRFEPQGAEGKSIFTGKKEEWSDNAAIPTKAKLAVSHGATALILVNPATPQKDDNFSSFARQFQFDRASIPVIQVKREVASALLTSAGAGTLAERQKKIDEAGKPASVALAGPKVAGEVAFKRTEKDVRNVAAVLPGKGPHADEWIVVGAHYDHLGKGGPGSLAPLSKEIHPGADDNASGTTAMLKIAELTSKLGPQDRSILFIAFTAEELGLIGSNHFVGKPPMPTEKIAAMLNLDMVGRIRDNKLQVGGSGTAPSFDKILKDATEGAKLQLNLNSKGGLGPSDHTSFATKKIPVLFFFSGLHLDYHRPSDTADKINYEGMADVIGMGEKVVRAMAAMPREQYVATFDSQGLSIMGSSGSASGGARASLGVVPDYSDDTLKGVRITGTSPGSAAEKAGLKDGDILTGWGDRKLDNLQDLMSALTKAKPGDKVKIKVQRAGAEVEVEATLTERKG